MVRPALFQMTSRFTISCKLAKTKLALYKLSGRGGAEIDKEGAIALLEERVKDKDVEAMWMLGLCYEYGICCEQDLERAEKFYDDSSAGESVIGKFLSEVDKNSVGRVCRHR